MKELIKNHVRELRQNTTDSEKYLWFLIRAKRLNGYKFRRQHLVYPYIVDFICLQKKLIIELDGGQHAEQHKYDEKRTAFLESKGYKVLRFWNNEVIENTEAVVNDNFKLFKKGSLKPSSPQPSPPKKAWEERGTQNQKMCAYPSTKRGEGIKSTIYKAEFLMGQPLF